MDELEGVTTSNPKKIELKGQFGFFSLPEKPNSIAVNFFSTIAGNNEPNSRELLRELRPLREIVPAEELDNLDSILQRDLDDYRIATSLIPYITGKTTNIAFFPSVLAVLLPKGYLIKGGQNKVYPRNLEARSSEKSSYGDFWQGKKYKVGPEVLNLGQMTIHLDKTDIIVIDGQHRSNAFRFVSGEFGKEDIYASFYKNVMKPETFSSDLPVTLIWFDSQSDANTVDPTLVARKLFVDVNNSAKSVSESRTILLDDYEIASLLTKFFYNFITSKNSERFTTSSFSLVHSGFDLNTDLDSAFNNPLILTNPQIVYYFMSWFFLGTRAQLHDLSKYSVSSDKRYKTQIQFFEKYLSFDGVESRKLWDDDSEKYVIKDIDRKSDFYLEYVSSGLAESFYKLFDSFVLYRVHIDVTNEIDSWYIDGMNTSQKKVWEKVFKGGEGLFYTFDSVSKKTQNEEFKTYLKAIQEIKDEFQKRLHSKFTEIASQDITQAYETIRTKAFQCGLMMTIAYLKEFKAIASIKEATEKLSSALNSIGKEALVNILVRLKSQIPDIKDTDPKKWLGYTRLFLRIMQDHSTDCIFYTKANYFDSPEGRIFRKKIEDKVWAYRETNENVNSTAEIDEEDLNNWVSDAVSDVKQLINLCSLNEIEFPLHELYSSTTALIDRSVFKR